jgi:hypothetical protein
MAHKEIVAIELDQTMPNWTKVPCREQIIFVVVGTGSC